MAKGNVHGFVEQTKNNPSEMFKTNSGYYKRSIFKLYSCAGCGRGAMAHFFTDNNSLKDGIIDEFFPISADVGSLPTDTPEDIKEEFNEALKCFGVGAYRAASAMARSVLEKVLVSSGYVNLKPQDNLYLKIEAAGADGTITKSRMEFAHNKVRSIGNDVLHDPWEAYSLDDAETALHYAQRIIEDFYDNRSETENVLRSLGRIP